MEKKKIYAFNNGPWGDHDIVALAVGEDGYILASHICSNPSFIAVDLGITTTRCHDGYNKHFGEGQWEIEYVKDPASHAGYNRAMEEATKRRAAENNEHQPSTTEG
jgi:hypothetical protein